jgi:hypothetical protein
MEHYMDKEKVIIRHARPNEYDHAEQGTECRVMWPDGAYEMYIQMSSSSDNPQWLFMGIVRAK